MMMVRFRGRLLQVAVCAILIVLMLLLQIEIRVSWADEVVEIEAAGVTIVDSEKPVIDVDSLQVDKSEATVGDVVVISIQITDNEALGSVVISFDNADSGKMVIYKSMYYDESTSLWKYQFEVSENISNGLWILSSIQAYDGVGNVNVFSPHMEAFRVYGAADSERPIIYTETLSANMERATVRDNVIVSLEVTDNEALDSVIISFDNVDSGKMVIYKPMSYNSDSDVWEYIFSVSEETPNGVWVVSNIQAYDNVGNMSSIRPGTEIFTVYGAADSERPVIDSESLSISSDTATYDDHVRISIIITDNVAVDSVAISLDNRNTGKMVIYKAMIKMENSDVWEYDFYIGEDISDGVWELSSIQAYDEAGNGAIYAPHIAVLTTNHIFDFSNASGMRIPRDVRLIDAEAFYGCDEEIVTIPSSCKSIQTRSFAFSAALHRVWIPASVESIAADAFEGSNNVIIYGSKDSYAEQYAEEHDIPFVLNE